jgi:tetratricopeptide (TPR) repeat protein
MKPWPAKTGGIYARGVALAIIVGAAIGKAAPASDPGSLATWIESLGDASEPVRDEAYARLFTAGRSARVALLARVDDPSPTRRKLARQLLKELPLFDDSEPASLRTWLSRFQSAEAIDRPAVALQIARAPDGLAAATRLVFESTDDELVWSMLSGLDPADRVRIAGQGRADGYVPTTAPQWFLIGDVATSAAQRLEAFQRSFDKASAPPPEALQAMSRIANALCADARNRGDTARELAVRRDVALLMPASKDGLSLPASVYLETRLQLRSAEGLEDDLLTLDLSSASAEMALVKAILSASPEPMNKMPTLLRDVPAPIVAAADALKPQQLIGMLELLGRAGDVGLADALASRLISQLRGVRDPSVKVLVTRAIALRYMLAEESQAGPIARLQDFVRQLPPVILGDGLDEEGLEPLAGYVGFCKWQMEAVRRAVFVDDRPRVEWLLDRLMYVPITSSKLAIDAIYVFEMFGRLEAADEVYAECSSLMQAQLDAFPNNSSLLNRIAWFSARTGRDLDNAYGWARRALAIEPRSPAITDTFAEAAFRVGKVEEAVAAERRALAGRPGDPFMTNQLRRFESGLRPGDAERPLFSEDWNEPFAP